MTATRTHEYSAFEVVLYLAFELSNAHWRLGFTTGPGRRPRQRTINARDLEALKHELRRARKRFNLPESTRVVSCYEAGRDGFSLKGRRDGVAAPLPGRAGDREPGSGQLEHPG